MTKNIIIVPGSIRSTSVAKKIAKIAQDIVDDRDDIKATIVDLGEIDLPFFDNPNMPASPDFTEEDERVRKWTKLVADADGVLFVSPEYNHNITAVQKNAIDWVYKEWENKPVASISFGWHGAKWSIENIKEALGNVKANFLSSSVQLFFMKDINPDGTLIDTDGVTAKITNAIDGFTEV